MPADDADNPDDRLLHEAEELMRQRRFADAASRYDDLQQRQPTDLWIRLGRVSALECAGQVEDAVGLLEETAATHRRSSSYQRFRHLFFVRREDFAAANASQRALRNETIDDGPDDQLADLYFNQGRYREARAELERLLESPAVNEGDSEFRTSLIARLGACLRQTGDAEGARARLGEALTDDPANAWVLSELAEAERALGNHDTARRRYLEALEASPDDHWTRGHLAQLEFEDGDIEASITQYRTILESVPDALWARVELAQVLSEKDPAEARALCHGVINEDKSNPWAHAQLGNLARRAGDLDEARGHYQRALQGNPDAVWVLHELADTLRHLGRRDEGWQHLHKALEVDPYHPITYGYLADFLRHDNRSEEALAHLAKAIELDGNYLWAWRETAELKALAGDHPAAEEAWRKAEALDPDAAINDGLKAFLLRCQNRREAALPWLERAVDRQPEYLWAWRERCELLLAAGRNAEAETVAAAGVAALPKAAPLHLLLAEAQRRLGRRDDALESTRRAIDLDGLQPQSWAIQAELLLERGALADALASARRAVALAPAAPEFRALLAQMLVTATLLDEAQPMANALLVEAPGMAPAWELAAVIAERRGDPAAARAILDRALDGPCAEEPRLRVRRARLGAANHEAGAADDLAQLVTAEGAPLKDLASLLAQSDQAVPARRAAYLALERAGEDRDSQVRAWLQLAETELALGQGPAADVALAEVLERDPHHLQGRLLGAVIADRAGDHRAAISHLTHLDHHLTANGPHAVHPAPPLLRQLALMYERSGEIALAETVWKRAIAAAGEDDDLATEQACFFTRHGDLSQVPAVIAATESRLTPGTPLHRRLLREAALAAANRHTPAHGAALLEARLDALGPDERLLLARLHLAAEHPAEALIALQEAGDGREATLVAVRALMAAGRAADGQAKADRLRAERPDDEEATTLAAECRAAQGAFADALDLLDALPRTPGSERALLHAVLALEERSEAWALAILSRLEPDHGIPLVRVFAAAWPGAWTSPDPARPATADDVLALPPFPRLARRLGAALVAADRDDLAGAYLTAVVDFRRRHLGAVARHTDRDLTAQACAALTRAGRGPDALALAGRGWSLRGLLAWATARRRRS